MTLNTLRDVATKNNIKLAPEDEQAYLTVLQGAEMTSQTVFDLPDYVDPRLAPVPTVGGERTYWRSASNSLNAWSHQCNLQAENPVSDLLKGRTVVVKDNYSVGGLPYTAGIPAKLLSKDGVYPISQIDAPTVQRVLEAGATLRGTSTCENYSLCPMSYTSANGAVHNPWLPNYNTGGSSSGSACLLALRNAREAGVPGLENAGDDIDLAMGGDQAASIRVPASYCGVYGLKPTHGLVPYTGIAGLHPMIDYSGPMARTVEDIALLLTAVAGYDGLDPRMNAEAPLRDQVKSYHKELKDFTDSNMKGRGLRVGIISESLTLPGTEPEVAAVVKEAATRHFTEAGATVSEVSVPMHLLGPLIWMAAVRNHMAKLSVGGRVPDILHHNMPHFTPRWPPDQEMYEELTNGNPAVLTVIFGETFLSERFGMEVQAKAHRHVFELRAAYDRVLQDYDILITPTAHTVAPPHPDMRAEKDGGSSVMDKLKLAIGSTSNTNPFNASGHPALSVPCGWATAADGKSKLPVGMQIIGKRWDEMGVLKAAKAFEQGGGGLGKWPGLATVEGSSTLTCSASK